MHDTPNFMNPDFVLVVLTWITFFTLLLILYKYAWKPILAGLDEREGKIRRSIEGAKQVEQQLASIDQTCEQKLKEADEQAKLVLERGRKGAKEASKVIQSRAREEAQIMLGNAQHEINAKREKAHMQLRQESVDLAIELAGKIIEKDLSAQKHKILIANTIKSFNPREHDES